MNETPYPWLTIEDDGTMETDMMDCTPAEQDRRLVIVQELQAGRMQLSVPHGENGPDSRHAT